MSKLYKKDWGLTSEQLDSKYNLDGGGQHPGYTRWYWRQDVAGQDTLRGYWDWLVSQLVQEEINQWAHHKNI